MTDRTPVLIERLTKCEGMITKSGAVNVSATLGLLIEARDALAERAAMPTRALNLLQVIADPECDPNDFAADGITVFQVIQRDAQETLALFARNQTDGETK